MLFYFFQQIVEVDIALVIGSYDHYGAAAHHRCSGIGTVRRGRYQRYGTMSLTDVFLIGADHLYTCILALCAGVGLQ